MANITRPSAITEPAYKKPLYVLGGALAGIATLSILRRRIADINRATHRFLSTTRHDDHQ